MARQRNPKPKVVRGEQSTLFKSVESGLPLDGLHPESRPAERQVSAVDTPARSMMRELRAKVLEAMEQQALVARQSDGTIRANAQLAGFIFGKIQMMIGELLGEP